MKHKMVSITGVIFGGSIGAKTKIDDEGIITISLRELKYPVENFEKKDFCKDCYDNLQVDLIFPTLEYLTHFRDVILQDAERFFKECKTNETNSKK